MMLSSTATPVAMKVRFCGALQWRSFGMTRASAEADDELHTTEVNLVGVSVGTSAVYFKLQ